MPDWSDPRAGGTNPLNGRAHDTRPDPSSTTNAPRAEPTDAAMREHTPSKEAPEASNTSSTAPTPTPDRANAPRTNGSNQDNPSDDPATTSLQTPATHRRNPPYPPPTLI